MALNWTDIRYIDVPTIKMLEQAIRTELPADYVKEVCMINGGALANGYVDHPELGKVPYKYSVSLLKGDRNSVYDFYDVMTEYTDFMFPIGATGEGDFFCIDLKNNKIVLWIHGDNITKDVCDTYTEFLEMIKED